MDAAVGMTPLARVQPRRRSQPRFGWPEELANQVCFVRTLSLAKMEYQFHDTRKWRFDLAWPSEKLAVEVDGGGFVNGRHSRGTGIEKDCEKYAEAMLLGWRVLRVTPRQVKTGQALKWIEQLIQRSVGR